MPSEVPIRQRNGYCSPENPKQKFILCHLISRSLLMAFPFYWAPLIHKRCNRFVTTNVEGEHGSGDRGLQLLSRNRVQASCAIARHHFSSNRSSCERWDVRKNDRPNKEPLIFIFNFLSNLITI